MRLGDGAGNEWLQSGVKKRMMCAGGTLCFPTREDLRAQKFEMKGVLRFTTNAMERGGEQIIAYTCNPSFGFHSDPNLLITNSKFPTLMRLPNY